jgi:hypothetical protein
MAISQNDDAQEIKGASDGTLIGNVGDRLKVDASISQSVSDSLPRVNQGMDLSLNKSNGAWLSMTSYTGSGLFLGAACHFDNENVQVRLLIDGVEQYIVDCSDLDDLYPSNPLYLNIYWEREDEKLFINWPAKFNSSFALQAKASDNNNSRDVRDWLVMYEVDP